MPTSPLGLCPFTRHHGLEDSPRDVEALSHLPIPKKDHCSLQLRKALVFGKGLPSPSTMGLELSGVQLSEK